MICLMWVAKQAIEALNRLKYEQTRLPKPNKPPVSSIRKALDRYGR